MTSTSVSALPSLLGNVTMTKNLPVSSGIASKPTQVATPNNMKKESPKIVDEAVKEEEDEENSGTSISIITAIGGTALGAAGVGLVFMKKRNPSQYEDLKQKFPEAFTQVKRNLTRGATQLKRKMTRKPGKPVSISTQEALSISTQ